MRFGRRDVAAGRSCSAGMWALPPRPANARLCRGPGECPGAGRSEVCRSRGGYRAGHRDGARGGRGARRLALRDEPPGSQRSRDHPNLRSCACRRRVHAEASQGGEPSAENVRCGAAAHDRHADAYPCARRPSGRGGRRHDGDLDEPAEGCRGSLRRVKAVLRHEHGSDGHGVARPCGLHHSPDDGHCGAVRRRLGGRR